MNIAEHMQEAAYKSPKKPAIALGSRVVQRYGGLGHRVAQLAYSLRYDQGLQEGDRVALIMKNCPEYLETLYACWHAGLIAVPINAKLHVNEFAYILEDSGARFCFATSHLLEDEGERLLSGSLEKITDVHSALYAQMFSAETLTISATQANDIAWIFYTSGTTGQPKGAALTHGNLQAMCESYLSDVDPKSPWLSILHAAPMSHGSGLYALPHVIKASCHVIPESSSFAPSEIYELIEYWPSLVFFAAPTMVKRLLDYHREHEPNLDTTNLKTIIYGGGPMYLEDTLAGIDRFGPKFSQLYGQGESPMTITALNSDIHADSSHPRWHERLASVGKAQSAVEVCVADSQDKPLPPGEVGEVLVRGKTLMSGYWKKPEATAETLRNGWLHTGDFGCFDEDGFLTLKDRGKDLIISAGTNIYPREVEEVLIQYPAIAEVSVIGRDDREWGEVVIAYIVAHADQTIDQEALDQFCIENMARFKRPKHYRIIEKIPKNNYGKVLKTELRLLEQQQQ